jgi:hypothetical protein
VEPPHGAWRRINPWTVAAWGLVIGLGFLFFSMNTGTAEQRADWFSTFKIATHAPNRFCLLAETLAALEADHTGQPVGTPCGSFAGNVRKGVVWLGRLGFNRLTIEDSNWLGFVLAAAFVLCLGAVLRISRGWHILLYAFLLFSPPVLLVLELGTLDLVAFCLVVLAIVVANRYRRSAGGALLFAAGIVAYYPFAAIPSLPQGSRRNWLGAALFMAGALLFLLLAPPRGIARLTPQFAFVAVALVAAVAVVSRSYRELAAFLESDEPHSRSFFLAGCFIYPIGFLFFAPYDFRDIFMVLLIPHLLTALQRNGYQRGLAGGGLATVALIIGLTWLHGAQAASVVQQACYWLLFAFCTAFCITETIRIFWTSHLDGNMVEDPAHFSSPNMVGISSETVG